MTQAPGTLHLVQSFASTLGAAGGAADGADPLRAREDAAAWLRTADLLDNEAGLSNSEHAALLRLREAIRDSLAAHTDGSADADAAARLTRALADGRLVITVAPDSSTKLISAARASYPCIVAAIAVAIADASAAGTWMRLKLCATAGCDQIFYDDSPAVQHCSAHAG
ncbi:MAG TPA: ABATE domain-containing protein [Streptosporangiaceae bacterium]